MNPTVLMIACGALSHELVELQRRNCWTHIRIQCLPAELHNTPEKIPAAVAAMIEARQAEFAHIFVAYADCGTGGMLDRVLDRYGIARLPGAHCYEFFAGADRFAELVEQEAGTFYLTDFLARHFDRLVKQGLGLDRHPELIGVFFAHYRRLLYLAQAPTPELSALARSHADFLGLEYVEHHTGLDPLNIVIKEPVGAWQN